MLMETTGSYFEYANPVIRGNSPDPSVIRVGGDYFLAVSTFEFLPGLIIRHSTDLENWTIIGAGVTRPAQYRRDGLPGAIMLFAPTLRYHNGTYYLVCTNMADGQGNFMLTTTDLTADWSDAIWLDREAFDPSLFFDIDSTCYYTRRSLDLSIPGGDLGPIVQGILDVTSGQLSPLRAITAGPCGFLSNDIEGPHLYRIGEWYYLFAAEGSTWIGHMQTIGRSHSPWGPFEPAPHNPVITHRNRILHPIQTLGHADLVEDPYGQWWALCLGTRHREQHHNLGRETFLLPVNWQDGWPYFGNKGGTEVSVTHSHSPQTKADKFAFRESIWTKGWHMLGQPPEDIRWQNGSKGDNIELPYGPDFVDGTIARPTSALFRFQTEETQNFSACVAEPQPNNATGITAYSDLEHRFELALFCESEGKELKRFLRFRRQVDDLITETFHQIPATGTIEMTIRAEPKAYHFSANVGGDTIDVGSGSARLLSAESCDWFVGVNFGLFAFAPTETQMIALFKNVRIWCP